MEGNAVLTSKRWNRRAGWTVVLLLLPFFLHGSAHPATAPSPNQFLIASDIHFNPFADPALVPALVAAPSAQWEAILNRSRLAAYSQYSHDTNWWLLQSSLDAMRSTLPNPSLVMITGDLLAHGFPQAYAATSHDPERAHYRAFVRKTTEFLALELRKRYRKARILLTPGNNDDECGDYDIEADGPFLSDTVELAQGLAQADDRFRHDWKALGSYVVEHPTIPGLRIVSLNTVFFSNKYQAASFSHACSQFDSAAASRAFAWLESSLAQAKEAHEKVWLMLHIPPGIDGYSTMAQYRQLSLTSTLPKEQLCRSAIVPMWNPVWTAKFDSLLESFQGTVLAGLAGHDHTDDFRLIGDTEGTGNFILINPPISPIYGQNPSFRVVTFRPDGQFADQSTFYLTNLRTASRWNRGEWKREYRFSQQWHLPQLDARSLTVLYRQVENESAVRAEWLRLWDVSSPVDRIAPAGVRTLFCASGSLSISGYQACDCAQPAAESR